MPSQPLWKSSHLAHVWHDTHSTWHHNHTLWHHSSVFMTSQPLHSWHQIPYIWHHLQGLWHLVPYTCDIADTMFVNTYQLYLTTNTRCRDNTKTISEITTSICVSVGSHTLYRRYNTHCIDDMAPTVFMAQYPLYMTSHPRFIMSQHSTHDIKAMISHLTPILSDSTSTVSLSSHPDYWSYNPNCMYDNTAKIWHHTNNIWHHIHSLWYHTTLWHHTHCIHIITPRIPVIESTVAGQLLIVYWLYHAYYMCDMKPTICMTSQEFSMTSHSLFMT